MRNRYFIDLGPISTGLNAIRLGFLQPCPIKNLCNAENIPGNFTLSRDPPLSPEHIANFQTMLGSPGIFRLQVGKTPSLSRTSLMDTGSLQLDSGKKRQFSAKFVRKQQLPTACGNKIFQISYFPLVLQLFPSSRIRPTQTNTRRFGERRFPYEMSLLRLRREQGD